MAERARPRRRTLTDAERWRLLDDLYQRVLFRPVPSTAKKGRTPFQSDARPPEAEEETNGVTSTGRPGTIVRHGGR